MTIPFSTTDISPVVAFRSKAEITYHIEGRILCTTATGPFKDELVAAIPLTIKDMLIKLTQQGKWGQIVTLQRDASASPEVLAEFAAHLTARYSNPDIRPVTALVFGPHLKAGQAMAPEFRKCYETAGVECSVFEDYSTAQYWVKSKIRQTSILVEWLDIYKIGDQTIDEQHKELFMRAADVIAATNRESQTMSALRLYQYTRSHFSHEEGLMERIGYPDISAHLAQHKALMTKLDEFLANIAKDNLIKADLEDFVSQWFLGHIANVDAKLAAYLRS
jgi:hemerythrin